MNPIEILEGFLKRYVDINKNILDRYAGQRDRDLYSVFLYNFLERFYLSVNGILCLTPKMKESQLYKFPVAIMLRNIISDYLTVMYFLSYLKIEVNLDGKFLIEEANFLEATHRIDRTFFRVVQKEMQLQLDEGRITPEEANTIKANLQRFNPDQFETELTGEIRFKNRDEIQPKTMARHLKEIPEYKRSADAYVYYAYYSQFEHISRVSKEYLYNYYEEKDIPAFIGTVRHLFTGTLRIIDYMLRIDRSYSAEILSLIMDFTDSFPPSRT